MKVRIRSVEWAASAVLLGCSLGPVPMMPRGIHEGARSDR